MINLKQYRDLQRSPDGPFSLVFTKPVELILLPLIVRLPVHPNLWTLLSFATKLWGGWKIYRGQFDLWLPFILALSLILDGFDGDVARWRGEGSYLGAYLDRGLDRLANCLIVSAFCLRLFIDLSSPDGLILAFLVISGEMLHDVLRTWISLTGGLLEDRDPLPRWDKWLRNHGILPFYAQDTLYFLLGIAPLIMSTWVTGVLLAAVLWSSFLYLEIIHRSEALQSGSEGINLWRQFVRWGITRIFFLSLLIVGGYGLIATTGIGPAIPFTLIWLDFLVFYGWANLLMSESARMPEEPDQREQFIQQLRMRDRQFLFQWYP